MVVGRRIRLAGTIAASNLALITAWGTSNQQTETEAIFYQHGQNEWISSSSNIAMKVEGCVIAATDDNEDVGCMEDESGDGTTYWYQMAGCRRAQVAYSVYATNSGSASCSSAHFKGTYVTQDGLSEFATLMGTYDGYSPISEDTVGDLPMCEQGNNGYYLSVGCASDGSFTIDEFDDQYCNSEPVGTYSSLSDISSLMRKSLSCYTIYSQNTDESIEYSTAGALTSASQSCSNLDSSVCTSTDAISGATGGKMSSVTAAGRSIINFNVANKAKYALGTLCLIGSLFMFLGILFTNRRKRRAMMQRKMRASRSKRSGSKKRSSSRHKSSSSRSKSRSRTASSSKREDSASRSRSKSKSGSRSKSSSRKPRSERESDKRNSKAVDDGVFA